MTPRRFVLPKVTEIRLSRGDDRAHSFATPSQRDLVTASLLLRPYAKSGGGRRRGPAL